MASNGLYNIRDGSFKEFTPDVVITNKIPWPYNPAAHDDLLDHTLNRLACDDPEVRALLEEMVGYCMYRRNELGMDICREKSPEVHYEGTHAIRCHLFQQTGQIGE